MCAAMFWFILSSEILTYNSFFLFEGGATPENLAFLNRK